MNLRIAWINDEPTTKPLGKPRKPKKLRKPTYAEEVEALSEHLGQKWRKRDKAEADKITECPPWAEELYKMYGDKYD